MSYWYTPFEADSLNFVITHKEYIDTLTVRLRSKEIDSLLVGGTITGTLHMQDTFAIATNIPIHKIDTTKISFIDQDSLSVDYRTELDASKMNLKFHFDKEYGEKYQFKILPEAVKDLFGNVNDTINISLSTKQFEDYGVINVSLLNVESYPIILELMDEQFRVLRRIYSSEQKNIYKFEDLVPKNYRFRVIYDANDNKKWDTGNFLKRQKPERIVYCEGSDGEVVEIRANWVKNETFILK